MFSSLRNEVAATHCMFAIVCSKATSKQWRKAVDTLHSKYAAFWGDKVDVIQYEDDVKGILPKLQRPRPSYCCFLSIYSECTEQFVRSVHSLTRKIDPTNPFTDTLWGILTGQDEADVICIIQQDALLVRRVLGGTSVNLNKFQSGIWYSEGEQGVAFRKKLGCKETVKETCLPDATVDIVAELSSERDEKRDKGVDMIITSGHATEHDWNIGYSFPSGKLVPIDGKLCGRTLNGELVPVKHGNSPRVYSACGNCLMGHITEKNCMALAWMHTVGVVQMTGYINSTWFGYAGWGVNTYFIDNPGMLTFAESFFANQQSLIAKLHSEYHEFDNVEDDIPSKKQVLTEEYAGLLYDKDSVAFYGDPAYESRLVTKEDQWSYDISLTELDSSGLSPGWSKWQMKVRTKHDGSFSRPPVYIFPCTMSEYRVIKGEAIVNCRFVMLPLNGQYTAGKEFSTDFAVKL